MEIVPGLHRHESYIGDKLMGSGTHSVLRPYYQTSYYLPPFLSAHE